MNFLAHIYLSGDCEKVKVGNFIADWIKGKQYEQYHVDIQKGILLHRAIDSFTDNHILVKQCKTIFVPVYGRYSGIIVDIFFDHFLSTHWNEYSKVPLNQYITHTYSVFNRYSAILPFRVQRIFPSLVYHNWIGQYGSFYGLSSVLNRMAIRTSLPLFTEQAIYLLKENYQKLDINFCQFFEELQAMVEVRDSRRIL